MGKTGAMPVLIAGVRMARLRKGSSPSVVVSATTSDGAAASAIPEGTTIMIVSCLTASGLVAVGEAASATAGIPFTAGLPVWVDVGPILAGDTAADDTPHIKMDSASASVRLTYLKDS